MRLKGGGALAKNAGSPDSSIGYTPRSSVWPTVTGDIFEFGFPDALLQMWAVFLAERAGELGDRFGCATPREALLSHRVFAAALASHQSGAAVAPG